jgi:hypothetical protein
MEDLDFTDLAPNEILDALAESTRWLAEQYKFAMQALPPEMVVAAFQSGDAQKTFFINSGNTHLPVMAAATESMKSAPTVEFLPPIVPLVLE